GHRDADGLEEVVACVVPMPGKAVDGDELIAFCREGLAAFKRPRQVLVLEGLPKTATGKIQRVVVREISGDTLRKWRVARTAPDVLVVGAGVSGLTTAICLAETGRNVEIRADRPPQDTTYAVGGAIWGPHLVETGERAARWRRATLAVLRELAAGAAGRKA